MKKGVLWTPERLNVAKKTLKQYPLGALDTVCAKLTETFGARVNTDSLGHAFKRAGFKDPSSYMAGAQSEAKTPLERHDEKNKTRRLEREHKELVEQLKEANERHAFLDRIGKVVVPKLKPLEKISGMREGTAVFLASDWHVEENVAAEQCAGLNEYNLKIARERAERYFVGVRWLIDAARASYSVRRAVFWLGGDLITGYIHAELQESNELSPVEAVLAVKEMMLRGIYQLLQDPKLEMLYVPCSFGNHGRTTEKRRIKTGAQNSFEWLLYNILAQHFAGEKRVQFTVDKSAHQWVDVYDFGLHFTHGDELKYGGGVGGLAIPLGKRVPTWDRLRPTALHHIGHFHQLARYGRTFTNGSLIGYNEYAVSIGASYEPPQQHFYIVDSKRCATMQSAIWCAEEATGKRAA